MYTYEAAAGELETETYDATTWRVNGTEGGIGEPGAQAYRKTVIAAKQECYTPTFAGKERVAGRETYVIDLGSNRCAVQPSGGGPGGAPVYFIMPTRLWIDVETFSVVRQTKVGGPNDQLRSSTTLI